MCDNHPLTLSWRNCRSLALAVIVATLPVRAFAAVNFYVATTGNDANPGTLQQPWRTIQKAANTAVPGGVVYVRGGVYHERVNINVSGSAAQGAITFRNYAGENPVIDGTGLTVPAAPNGLFLIADRSYLIIQGFELRNYKTATLTRVPQAFMCAEPLIISASAITRSIISPTPAKWPMMSMGTVSPFMATTRFSPSTI